MLFRSGQKNYDKCFEDIGFKAKNGKYPKYAGSSKEGKKILLFFQSTIPLSEWRSARERLETALDCSIIKIENGRNKRTVKLTIYYLTIYYLQLILLGSFAFSKIQVSVYIS